MDLQFDFTIARTTNPVFGRDGVPQLFRDTLTDIFMIIDFVIGVAGETVDVNLGQKVSLLGLLCRVRGEQRFMPGVDAWEGFEEINGCGREVHNIVIENGRSGV